VDNGKITAYHWELDSRDNTLTEAIEKQVPNAEGMLFEQFNPGGGVPTYVFGCKYVRIGNAYEREGDAGLLKEEMEFRKIIDELIASSTT
jgi:hypothetical protein